MGLLDGKTAIVTGAARGIGRAEALLLAAEGAAVVLNDIDGDEAHQVRAEVEAGGGQAAVDTNDITTFAGAEALVAAAYDRFGGHDILVNNAGILRDAMSFSIDEDDWDDVIRVHLKGHLASSRAAARRWRERAKGGESLQGRIVNTASESGLYGLAGQVNYASAKAAIASMTIVLARELHKYGVTVNAIAPRARTRMTETVLTGIGPNEDGFDEWDPANIAPTVAWLASDLAADVTGQVFVVFAGRIHLMGGWHLAGTIEQEQRWDPRSIDEHRATLFAERSCGLPPMGFGR